MHAGMGSGLSSNQQQSKLTEITNSEMGVQVQRHNTHFVM